MEENFLDAALTHMTNEVARLQLVIQALREENQHIHKIYQEENTRLKHEIKRLILLLNQKSL